MNQTRDYPCRLTLVETGVTLRSNLAGTIPDPGENIVMDSRGRIYANSNGIISVWKADGTFERNFGTQGDGPNEFRRGNSMTFMDGQDRLHFLTGSRQWTVISPTLQIISQVAAMPILVDDDFTIVTENGTVITSLPERGIGSRGPAPAPHWFGVADFKGALISTFGDYRTGGVTSDRPDDHNRQITYAGNNRFWASPERASKYGYTIEQWGLDGKQHLTLKREVPWYPDGPGIPQPSGQRPLPYVFRINADTSGLLITLSVIATEKWDQIATAAPERRREAQESAYNIYIEVIDTRAGVVLASELFAPPTVATAMVTRFMPGRMMAYRHVDTPDGLREARFVELRLTAR
jgi:hypothetical protein